MPLKGCVPYKQSLSGEQILFKDCTVEKSLEWLNTPWVLSWKPLLLQTIINYFCVPVPLQGVEQAHATAIS